jgi:hypothetical protein
MRRKPTNIARISIPQSQTFKNLQGRTRKRCISLPYFSYGNQYHTEEENLAQLVIICEILPKAKPEKRDIMKTSKTEDVFFLVSKDPLQKTYIPKSKTTRKRKRELTLVNISWNFSKTAKYIGCENKITLRYDSIN